MPIDPRIPLSALRTFESAARHLSFTRAAEELFVTQAAVSHQIRRLEAYLGVSLFRRFNRALLLTDEGQALHKPLEIAFSSVDQAVKQVQSGLDRGRLTVSILPSVASRWLVPRLGGFLTRNPDLDVRIAPSLALTDFGRDDVDCVIRYGSGNYPGLEVLRLFGEAMYPVCSPSLPGTHGPLAAPADLARYPLLHDDDYSDWVGWLRVTGNPDVPAERGPVFTDAGMLLQAAMAGQGVAIARSVLAEAELASGNLIQLFPEELGSEQAYFLAYPLHHGTRPGVKAFRAWLTEVAGLEPGIDASLPTFSRTNRHDGIRIL